MLGDSGTGLKNVPWRDTEIGYLLTNPHVSLVEGPFACSYGQGWSQLPARGSFGAKNHKHLQEKAMGECEMSQRKGKDLKSGGAEAAIGVGWKR